ncbi:hypothetical protein SAMD00019534_016130 [Acytostelium subglobosum LB1]|uniref:hypothetical protein n=1 Tax=Acytostelium subglobosum LB1 TaxID=1410327 RepID=UPI0006450BFE|nr:hypothetical protein SAMD00019534_016130 [Acytostelium subglobosum LB1]GAM18438.1 hypothetical protein SAMD00019534_016130 [Acytostelium subglobosum LB1]|eukprot:XP_012757658.1 hypothetical protein SAMD00019534_016130 [Acytostelium subglobosum LB1]
MSSERVNLSIEFHQNDGHVQKRVVKVDLNTKVGEAIRLLLDKFGKSSSEGTSSLYQLSITPRSSSTPQQVLADVHKSLHSYGIKNNDELTLRRRQKKNPATAKLAKKKPDGIFKTLFSVSTLEFKFGDEKTFANITDVEGRSEVPLLFFNVLNYLENYFNNQISKKTNGAFEISSSFQHYGVEGTQECIDLLRCYNNVASDTGDNYDFTQQGKVNIRTLCNFILYLLQNTFTETSLTYTLYTTFLKSTTLESKSNLLYETPPKNRIVLKQIMLFLSRMIAKDASLLDTLSTNIAPFILGRIESPNSHRSSSLSSPTVNPEHFFVVNKDLSPEELTLCKKVATDLIQNISQYLLYSPISLPLMEGEKTLFSAENIICIDKCNYPPSVATLGELWVTNYRIIFINAPHHTGNPSSSSSSNSIHSNYSSAIHPNSSSGAVPVLQPSISSSNLREPHPQLHRQPTSMSVTSTSSTGSANQPPHHSDQGASTTTPIGFTSSTSFSSVSVLNERLTTLENTEIPLSLIYRWKPLKSSPNIESFKIYCKDFRCKVIGFMTNSPQLALFRGVLESIRAPTVDSMFAFTSHEAGLGMAENYTDQLMEDYKRQGISWDEWRVNNTISTLKISDAYPLWSVVPKTISDNIVIHSALFRAYRFPALSWQHPVHRVSITRASRPDLNNTTPTISSMGGAPPQSPVITPRTPPSSPNARHSQSPLPCNEDIEFLREISAITNTGLLTVYDSGAPNNQASAMIGCKFQFLNLQPILTVRDAFQTLLHLHNAHPTDKKWTETTKFHWLNPMKEILTAAINIATTIEQGLSSVLIQGNSKEIDTEAQLASLSQLILDGHYRTLEGFRMLIEKEWLVYGYPFGLRCGHDIVRPTKSAAGASTSPSEGSQFEQFSPTFMQFIFLVWQLWKEFPSAFQFNEQYLLSLLDNVYSCRFGTFMGNNVKDREDIVFGKTRSFWSYVTVNQHQFTNDAYDPPKKSFLSCNRVYQDAMWSEFFYRHCFKSQFALERLEERVRWSLSEDALECVNQKLYILPDAALSSLTHLRKLNLSHNLLNTLPIGLAKLTQLESLNLEDNQLVNLSEETIAIFAKNLKCLREVNFSSNLFEYLPHTFILFGAQLKSLIIRNNKFTRIPDVIDEMDSLTTLDLSCQVVPITIPNMHRPSLTSLNLSETGMTTMPDEIGNLTSLRILRARNNRLDSLPASIAKLTQLEELYLDCNKITQLPSEICQLTQLHILSLEENNIKQLPSDISNLTHLIELNLRKNSLDILPASIGQLFNLRVLNLMDNNLTSLRPTMGLLTQLTTLNLNNNPLKTPPPEIRSQGIQAILNYLVDLIKGQEQCYRMKLMIVGQENVGKTSLLKALRDKKRKLPPGPNISTDGIVIDNWVFPGMFEELDENNRLVKKKQDINLSVWDFAGQEIYYTTHQFFLSERSVYLVAWNVILQEEDSRVEFWLQSITTRTKDAPIIIVGTHLDESNKGSTKSIKKRIREKYCARFPSIVDVKLVSCTSGKGINTLRERIEEIIASQPTMGESLPCSYMLLENLVKEETKKRVIPTIPWPEFMQLGTICTIRDEAELLRATMFLHQLGSLVYFPREAGLKQFVILDPQWITVMLSSIITTKHSYSKDGILHHKSLKQIWRPPHYPEHLHPHLIALLEKFEISYNVGARHKVGQASLETIDENAQSLIPSLLPNERPATFASQWPAYNDKAHDVQYGRIYKFEFVPNGFFSRLMVRILNFAKAEAKCYWRNGMLLQHDSEQIFIEMDNAKKQLNFQVRGKQSASLSRDVIETIQSLLDDSFQLTTQIFIPCIHCILNNNTNPFKFPLEVCENAAVKGITFLKCQNQFAVRTELLVPDLAMSNFTGSKIAYADLRVEDLIGEGGAALVYRGRWKGQTVAIKKLKTVGNAQPGPGGSIEINDISLSRAFNEFRRECWIMSSLEHPNIVQLKGLCLDPLCIVTEYLPNGNLYQFLHQPSQSISWVLRLKIALDISSGMAFLHSSTPPIIHRDLKSPNILLVSTDEQAPTIAKVVDFGLSGLQHTITNKGVENPVWLAPEIIQKHEASTQSDVYAFGVILWELLTFKDFFGELGFMSLIEDKVVSGERPPIPESCPPAYARLINDCWQNETAQRPPFSEIEDRIMAIVTDMFPNLQLTEPTNNTQRRKTLRSSQHRRAPSGSSEASDITMSTNSMKNPNDTTGINSSVASTSKGNLLDYSMASMSSTSTTTTTTTTTTSNFNLSNSSVMTLSSSQLANMKKSQDGLSVLTESQEEGFFKSLANGSSPMMGSSSTIKPPTTNQQQQQTKNFYHNAKRSSMTVQPFQHHLKQEMTCGEGSIQCMVVANNNVWAGTGSGAIIVWNKDSGEKVAMFKAHTRRIHCLYTYMNNVWSGSADNNVSIWNIDNFSLVKTFSGHSPTCFTSVGHTMWAGSIINVIHIFDIKKKVKFKGKIALESGPVEAILKREQEVWVALNNNLVRIDINSHRITQKIKGHEKAIHAIIEVDSTIWTCSSDGTIRVWGAQSGQHMATIQAHTSRIFCLALVGDYVWSGSWDTSIKIWNTKDYTLVGENPSKQKDAISCFVSTTTASRQRQVWSGSWDSSVAVWTVGQPGQLNSSFNASLEMYGIPQTSSSSSESPSVGGSPSPFSSSQNVSPIMVSSNGGTDHNTSTDSISQSLPASSLLTGMPSSSNLSTSPPGNSTLRSHARRTVSFMLDKFNKSTK